MRDTTTEENFPAGWYFSAAANLNHWFGLAGEITGAHKKLTDLEPVTPKANFYTFMGGPCFFVKRGRIVPFAQVLAGGAHLRWKVTGLTGALDPTHTDTKFAFQPGAGVTLLLTPNVSVRGAVDYRRIVFTDADELDEDNSQVRAIAGVVFGWAHGDGADMMKWSFRSATGTRSKSAGAPARSSGQGLTSARSQFDGRRVGSVGLLKSGRTVK